MQIWVGIFVGVAAVAILLQTLLLLAFYLQFRRLSSALNQVSSTIDNRLSPLMNRVERVLEDSQRELHEIVADSAEIVRVVKTNGQRFDRVLEEGAERLRKQIIHADRLLTGALDAVEDTGQELRNSLIEPLRTVVAFSRGVEAAISFLRGRSRTPERRRGAQDEGLFI